MNGHFPRAIDNGVTKDELVELITHMAFHSGWPTAMSAVTKTRELCSLHEQAAVIGRGEGLQASRTPGSTSVLRDLS